MGGMNSHRQVITGEDWMRSQEKRVINAERRPTIQHASDLLGPGFGPKMVLIRDWNTEEAQFNGFFVSPPGSLNTPDDDYWWGGITFGQNEGYGFQHVYDFRGTIWPPAQYVRKFYPQGTTTGYSAWMSVTGGGGPPGAHTHPISDVSALQSALDARALTGLTLTAGLGLTGGGNLTANRSFAVDFASSGTVSSTKAVRADDSRLSNSRTPVAHTHALNDLTTGLLTPPLTMAEIATPSAAPASSNRLYFKSDDRLYVMDTSGNERSLVPEPGSLPLNRSFDVHSGIPERPDNWNFFWMSAGATGVTDITTYYNGGSSLKLIRPTGENAVVQSSVFAVVEGGVVTLNFWARGASTGDQTSVGLLLDSAGNGDPDFFDGTAAYAAPESVINLTVGWAYYSLSWRIPTGKVTGRFTFRAVRASGTATAWIDETSSELRLAAEAQVETGSIILWLNTITGPTGYLPLTGGTYNTIDYPNLASLLGASGATFTLPTKTDTQSMRYYIKT